MPVQSRQTNVQILQSRHVVGGVVASSGTSGLSVPTGLSIVYTPTPGFIGELEVEVMIDGVTRLSGGDTYIRGEIWRNGSVWKYFGAPSCYTDTGNNFSASQIAGKFRDAIVSGSAITYAVQFCCMKNAGAPAASTIGVNWSNQVSIPTASFVNITEILQP